MGLKDLKLELSYETSDGDEKLLEEFYIPVLENSNKYYRIAGFFSSSSLVIAAKGIEGLIKNGGKMYLLISPELSEEDYAVIKEHGEIKATNKIFSDFDMAEMPHENVQALAWLLDNDRLEIKIVVGLKNRNSLFHQKVGIVFDEENNILSFSGSINETAQAWLNNIEEFKVFKSWEDGQVDYVRSDLNKFLSYWKNEHEDIAKVYDLPLAIKEEIVKKKPRDIWDLNIMRRYKKDVEIRTNELSLFPHQEQAVNMWFANSKRLLMEMATGTGKTRTAIGCLVEKLKDKEKICVVVATPQITLSQQWSTEFEDLKVNLDKMITVPGNYTSAGWKRELELTLLDLSDDKIKSAVIFTTHATAKSEAFIRIITENKYDTKILFICDEVHAIGSREQKKAMLSEYEYRIGLSATPERMFDEEGTNEIREYFGGASFEFTIHDALTTINPNTNKPFLNNFYYYPLFVALTEDEQREYIKLTQKIAIMQQMDDYEPDKLQILFDKRARISKDAVGKFECLSELLDEIGPSEVQDTIIFVSDKQIRQCFNILSEKKIKRAKITEMESADRIVTPDGETERQELIEQFRKRKLQVLVGMKCLDEGIDIKNARVAILMSNSTNPREYVQRVGRVIRQDDNKPASIIYDFIVEPSGEFQNALGILEKEFKRTNQIAKNALNYEEVLEVFREKGVDTDAD